MEYDNEKQKKLRHALDDLSNIRLVFMEALRADVNELYEIVSDIGIGDNCFDDIDFGADGIISWHEKFQKGMAGYNIQLLDKLSNYAKIANQARWILQFQDYYEKEINEENKDD